VYISVGKASATFSLVTYFEDIKDIAIYDGYPRVGEVE
jgi:hypothetical protein